MRGMVVGEGGRSSGVLLYYYYHLILIIVTKCHLPSANDEFNTAFSTFSPSVLSLHLILVRRVPGIKLKLQRLAGSES